MKIVVNAASAKMGGAVTYLITVLRSLPPPESGYEFDVFLPPETAEKIEGLPPNVRLIGNLGRSRGVVEETLVGTGHPAALAEEAES